MRLIRLLLLLPVIICLSGAAVAELGLRMDFYNPQDQLSVGLAGENMNYIAGVSLEPDSLSYSNSAQSVGQNNYYSYQVVLNGQNITSGAKTDSGSFNWSTSAKADAGIDPDQLVVGTNCTVENGTLYTYGTNMDYSFEQTIHAFNAVSTLKGTIMPHLMSSSGTGSTIENSSDNQIKGFQSVISVEHLTGDKKPADIDLNVNGDTDSQWQSFFTSNPSGYSFGQAIIGIMRPSDTNNLTMMGEAAGFPTQVLPYQGINISYQLNDANYSESFGRLDSEINDSINQSLGIYKLPGTLPVPVYNFDQGNLTNPVNIDITGKSAKEEMFYKMNIQFKVKV